MFEESSDSEVSESWTFGTLDDFPCVEFSDPFAELPSYLNGDEMIPPENFPDIVFIFCSSWIDPMFYRNRCTAAFPQDRWRPEELGFILTIHRFLGVPYPTPLSERLLTAFCVCTGRTPHSLKFDPSTSVNACKVSFRAPIERINYGEGPDVISPTFIQIAVQEKVPMPSGVFYLIEREADQAEGERGRQMQLNLKGTTVDEREALEFAGRRPILRDWCLTFDNADTVTVKITKFPLKDGTFWTRCETRHLQIAFGDDISNGTSKLPFKFAWENRFNGECPPTLSEYGPPKSIWIDDPQSGETGWGSPVLSRYCMRTSPGFTKDCVYLAMSEFDSETDWTGKMPVFLWADPSTGRIEEESMHFLIDPELEGQRNLAVVECNPYCPCRRNCPCCFTSHGPCPQLMLFYSPDKGWGVAATDTIEPGQLICLYAGKLTTDEVEEHSFYFGLEFGDYTCNIGYDASHHCNIGRFINASDRLMDSRFFQPNAQAINIVSEVFQNAVIGIFAARRIYRGEEVNIEYGDFYDWETTPCACNVCLREKDKMKKLMRTLSRKKK